jgi:hypothetical protein
MDDLKFYSMKYKHREKELIENENQVGFLNDSEETKLRKEEKLEGAAEKKKYYVASLDSVGDIIPQTKGRLAKDEAYQNALRQKKITELKRSHRYTEEFPPKKGEYSIKKNRMIFNLGGRQVVDVKVTINPPEAANTYRKDDVTFISDDHTKKFYQLEVDVDGKKKGKIQFPFPNPTSIEYLGGGGEGWSESHRYLLTFGNTSKYKDLQYSIRRLDPKFLGYKRGPLDLLQSGDIEPNPGPQQVVKSCPNIVEVGNALIACRQTERCVIPCHYHAVAIAKPPLTGAQRRIFEKEKRKKKPKTFSYQKCAQKTPKKCHDHHVHICSESRTQCWVPAADIVKPKVVEPTADDRAKMDYDHMTPTSGVVDDRKKARKATPPTTTANKGAPVSAKGKERLVPETKPVSDDTSNTKNVDSDPVSEVPVASSSKTPVPKNTENLTSPRVSFKQRPLPPLPTSGVCPNKNGQPAKETTPRGGGTPLAPSVKAKPAKILDEDGFELVVNRRKREKSPSIASTRGKAKLNKTGVEEAPDPYKFDGVYHQHIHISKKDFKEVEMRTLTNNARLSLTGVIISKILGGDGAKEDLNWYGQPAETARKRFDTHNELGDRLIREHNVDTYTKVLGVKLSKKVLKRPTSKLDQLYDGFVKVKIAPKFSRRLFSKEIAVRVLDNGQVSDAFLSRLLTTGKQSAYGASLCEKYPQVYLNSVLYTLTRLVAKDVKSLEVATRKQKTDFI